MIQIQNRHQQPAEMSQSGLTAMRGKAAFGYFAPKRPSQLNAGFR